MTVTTPELIQFVGLLLEAIFIPLFIWLGKALIRLHLDVQMLLKAVTKIEDRLTVGEDIHGRFEHRISSLEFQVKSLEEKLSQ